MFLRDKVRKKDGKLHRYWSVVENRRVSGNRVVQRQVLYLGEINDQQEAAWCAFGLVKINLPKETEAVTPETFTFRLDKDKLRVTRRREGTYLLRTNLTDEDPAKLWRYYIQLTEVEQAFKELKNDLSIRPIHHQLDHRIEAHIFVAFMAYCLQVTLKQRLKALAPGLTPRAVLEKFAAMQMIDVHLPTTDGRHIILSRHTEPNDNQQLLIRQMQLDLPAQPPPKIQPAARAPQNVL